MMVERALAVIGQYYYVFPSYTQARKALWDLRDNNGNRLFDLLPEWAISNTNSVEMKILLSNGYQPSRARVLRIRHGQP